MQTEYMDGLLHITKWVYYRIQNVRNIGIKIATPAMVDCLSRFRNYSHELPIH